MKLYKYQLILLLVLALIVCFGYIRNITGEPDNDARFLLKGVSTITFLATEYPPMKLSVFGDNAIVLAAALNNGDEKAGQSPIVASTTKENGNRVVVFGYPSFVAVNDADSKQFVSNILNWMSPGNGPVVIGINNGLIVLNNEDNTKFKQMPLNLTSLSEYDIIVVDDINTIDDPNLEKLKQISELSNKGLIMGISAYYNGYLNEEHMLNKNKLIGPIGIFWTSMWNYMDENNVDVNQEMLPTTHVSYAANKVRGGDNDQRYMKIIREFIRFTAENPISGYITSTPNSDAAILLKGVGNLKFLATEYPPMKLSVFGNNAVVLGTALKNGDTVAGQSPIVACTTKQNGNKFVVFGYPSFVAVSDTESKQFVSNILNWMSPGNGTFKIGINNGLIDLNNEDKTKFKQIQLSMEFLNEYDIIVVDDINTIDDANLQKLRTFSELSEKGLIMGISAYYNGYLNEKHMTKKNKLIGRIGIFWTSMWNEMEGTNLDVNEEMLPTTHVLYAANKVRSGDTDQRYMKIIGEFIRFTADNPISGFTRDTTSTPNSDAEILLNGVGTLTFLLETNPPLKLSVFGDKAVVLAAALWKGDKTLGQSPIVACTTKENGNKLVVFGYTSFVTVDDAASKKFVSNILNWMSPGNGSVNIGINNGLIDLNNRDNKKFKQMPLDLKSLSEYDIIVVNDINTIDNTNLEKLRKFSQLSDKGLIMGISSYYEGYLNDEHMLKKNKLIGPTGIFWTSMWNDMEGTNLDVSQEMLPTTHVSYAASKVRSGGNERQYLKIVVEFVKFTAANPISGYLKNITFAPNDGTTKLWKGVGNLKFLATEYPPMKLSVFGKNAVVLAAAVKNLDLLEGHSPIVACTTKENGNKFVVFGYSSFLTVNDLESKKFVSNILNWMLPKKGTFNLGINNGSIDLLLIKGTKQIKQMPLDLTSLESLSEYDIIVVDDINTIDDTNLEKLKLFSELSNKGLIMGISAYYEGYFNEKHMLKKNELIGPSGIFWTSMWNDVAGNNLDVNQEMLPTTHVSYAMDKVWGGDFDQRYVNKFAEFLRFTPDDLISGYIRNITTLPNDDAAIILKGVGTLQFLGTEYPPIKLSVFGENAVVLAGALRNGDEEAGQSPIVACTKKNGNRFVVFGYTSFVTVNDTESKTFVSNILNWMRPGNGTFNIGINNGSIDLNNKDNTKFKQMPLDLKSLESLSKYDIIVVNDINSIADANLEKLIQFSELSGKGLILGISAYYKGFLNEKHMIKKSKFIGPTGIFWTSLWNEMEGTNLDVNEETLPTTHVSYAANKLRSGDYDQRYVRIFWEFVKFTTETAPATGFMPNLVNDYNSRKIFGNLAIPNLDNPISDIMAKRQICVDCVIAQWIMKYEDPETIKAHPAALYYPSLQFKNWGKPVDNQSVLVQPITPTTFKDLPLPSKMFNLCQKFDNGKTESLVVPPYTGLNYLWYPTGMYARPGEVVTLQFLEATNISDIKVRIGINTDDLTFKDEKLIRYPKIDIEKNVDNKTFKIASLFGGLMYVVLPSNYDGQEFMVKFNGSYRAPAYVYGETTLDEWKTIISQPEAPWGELVTRGVIDLMLPTDYSLQKIIDPEQILTQFNKGIEGVKYLGDLEVASAVAYAPDYRIVVWGAHSGYPIVVLFNWLDDLLNAKRFCSASVAWGWWHELGHNFQYDRMYMSDTWNSTHNFFNVYNIATYCNLTIGDVIVERYKNDVSLRKWESEGRPNSGWLVNSDLELLMFLQLADKYGWESLRKLQKFYNKMRVSGDAVENIPIELSQRTDLLYVVYSQIVGEDLSSFIKAWSVPLSKPAEECVAGFGLKMSSLTFCSQFNSTSVVQNAIGFNCYN